MDLPRRQYLRIWIHFTYVLRNEANKNRYLKQTIWLLNVTGKKRIFLAFRILSFRTIGPEEIDLGVVDSISFATSAY